jgi:hypothetical protein
MSILARHTEIPVERTAAEIQLRLVKAGARAVMMEYGDDGALLALAFRIETSHGQVAFRLPVNVDGVLRVLTADTKASKSQQTRAHAARVAWRIAKVWIDSQLAIIEAGMANLPQVFMAYAQLPDGETVYERFERRGLPTLLAHDGAP